MHEWNITLFCYYSGHNNLAYTPFDGNTTEGPLY
jgi:hypothetical protein